MQTNILDITQFIVDEPFNNFDAAANPSKRAKLSKDPENIIKRVKTLMPKSEPKEVSNEVPPMPEETKDTSEMGATPTAPVVEQTVPTTETTPEVSNTPVETSEFRSDDKIMESFELKGAAVIPVSTLYGDNGTRLKISSKVHNRVSHADDVAKAKLPPLEEPAPTVSDNEPVQPSVETAPEEAKSTMEIPPFQMLGDTPPTMDDAKTTVETNAPTTNQTFDFNQKVDLGAMENALEETPENTVNSTEPAISPSERLDNYLTDKNQMATNLTQEPVTNNAVPPVQNSLGDDFDIQGLIGEIESLKKNTNELTAKIDERTAQNTDLTPKYLDAKERLEKYRNQLQEERLSLTQQYNLEEARNRRMAEVIQMSELIPDDSASKSKAA